MNIINNQENPLKILDDQEREGGGREKKNE